MKNILLSTLLIAPLALWAQKGPGGVGGHEDDVEEGEPVNALWLRADDLTLSDGDPVPVWNDFSDYGHRAESDPVGSEPPVFRKDMINGLPVIEFNGANSYAINDHDALDGGIGYAAFIVLNHAHNKGSSGSLVSKGLHWNFFSAHEATGTVLTQDQAQHAYDFWVESGDSFTAFINGNLPDGAGADVFTDTLYLKGTNFMVDHIFNKSWGSSIRINGASTNRPGRTEGNPNPITLEEEPVFSSSAKLRIGARYWDPPGWQQIAPSNYSTWYKGGIAEIIIYKGELDSTQMFLVENYLSAKYKLPLEDHKLYNDTVFTGDVAGIGTQSGDESKHSKSYSGAMILSELNESLDAPLEFLIAGSNAADYTPTADNFTGGTRWGRSWKLEKTGDMDAELGFDFIEAGITMDRNTALYRVLFRESLEDEFSVIEGIGRKQLRNLFFEIPNEQLKTGYYTLGYLEETAVDPYNISNHLSIFPNPVEDIAQVELSLQETGQLQIRLFDFTGRNILEMKEMKETTTYKCQLDLQPYTAGIYYLEIKTGAQYAVRAIVKE